MYLETQRLIVRNLLPEDSPQYRVFQNSLFVLRYNAMTPMDDQQVAAYIRGNGRPEGHLHRAVKGYGGRIFDDLLFSRQKTVV